MALAGLRVVAAGCGGEGAPLTLTSAEGARATGRGGALVKVGGTWTVIASASTPHA